MTIELTIDDYEDLILMLGYATGAAFEKGDRKRGYHFLALANRINEDNPNWTPYAIPEGEQNG